MKRRNRNTPTERNIIAASQKWLCAECGTLLSAHFHVDHKRALCNAGNNLLSNLQAICPNCHAIKTYRDMDPKRYEEQTGKSKYFKPGPLSLN